MSQPYQSAAPSMSPYPGDHGMQYHNPSSYPAYPLLLGSGHVPESLAYWHTSTSIQQPNIAAGVGLASPQQQQQTQQPQPQQPPPQQQPLSQSQSQQLATEQRKHKRTRSGCLTCRTRRIKVILHCEKQRKSTKLTLKLLQCDEGRPICESTCYTALSFQLY
jgi:hypothetical protein